MRRRKADGFVILPAAFSDGRLSREAWRAVKACLIDVRSVQHPSGLVVRAVRPDGSDWEGTRCVVRIPISATWVEIWRAIHRVHRVGLLRLREKVTEGPGVAVEPIRNSRS